MMIIKEFPSGNLGNSKKKRQEVPEKGYKVWKEIVLFLLGWGTWLVS